MLKIKKDYKHTLSMISKLDDIRISLWHKGGNDENLINLDIVLLDLRIKARELRKKMKGTT